MAGAPGATKAVDERLREKLTAEQTKEYTDVFEELDADGSKSIDISEVKVGLEQSGMTPSDSEVKELIARFDVDGDGNLNLDEWLELAATMFLGKSERELIQETFKVLDVDNKGFIQKEDVQAVLEAMPTSPKLPGGGLDELIGAVEPAKAGQITMEEFEKLLEKCVPQHKRRR